MMIFNINQQKNITLITNHYLFVEHEKLTKIYFLQDLIYSFFIR
jgi:hypothetical protein